MGSRIRRNLPSMTDKAAHGQQAARRVHAVNDSERHKKVGLSGAAGQDRTVDLVITNDALYH